MNEIFSRYADKIEFALIKSAPPLINPFLHKKRKAGELYSATPIF
ncbi:hypothetical protein GCM10011351_00280 [Paraliobacillus quinghaiensis]|uniref:Uncharacterized protein n=1 Tax=Paraliobacillus quinghaiensis TaxID=470815 RepID=A0A917TD16_9BACI|nr:hypothetical protein GCM10011351_00280 [Paraliobacillus quinghaiensis]